MASNLNLPTRLGAKPRTTKHIPHAQLDQHGPDDVISQLHEWAFSLPSVQNEPSSISVPGARALVMHDSCNCNHHAFMAGREFAHIHPHPDNGSMHVMLSSIDAQEVIAKGWGEDHFLVTLGHFRKGLVMVFSPRNEQELDAVKAILQRSYEFANSH